MHVYTKLNINNSKIVECNKENEICRFYKQLVNSFLLTRMYLIKNCYLRSNVINCDIFICDT